MAYCEIKYVSQSLVKKTAANLILPDPGVPGPYATLYLLHGLSDDQSVWQRYTSIERYVAGLPLIVVMPDGGRGFYCDAQQGMAWETAIVNDLMNYVDTVFHTKATRESRCLAGLSMGGYGAIKLALKHPDKFCSAVSHSGALGFGHFYPNPDSKPDDKFATEFIRVVGNSPAGGVDDCFALSEKCDIEQRPALRIDCGTEDFLLDSNRAFHSHMEKIGYEHEYEEFPGAHEWGYWDVHIQEAIAFHVKNLGLMKQA